MSEVNEVWQATAPTSAFGDHTVVVLTVGGKLLRYFAIGNRPESGADAAAVAAVPDLLAEVRRLAEIARIESARAVPGGQDWKGIHERLSAVIAKAEGRVILNRGE